MKWNSRTRCSIVCVAFAGLFSAFSFRLVYLQMVKHDEFSQLAIEKHAIRQSIYAERGKIRDAKGEILADNVPVETVVADATRINDFAAVSKILADTLELPLNEVKQKLEGDRRYIVIDREVPITTTNLIREKIQAQKLRGVYYERGSTRIYPNGPMLCHVVGFTDFEHKGIQGVEASMEDYLHGQDGFRFIEHARDGRELVAFRGQERDPRDGYDVNLTIDMSLQNIVENEIDAAVKEYTPKKATIILMRPDTGEILAMANRPNFDLNERADAKPEEMKNRAIIDTMEPGSTFKIVTAAAALNEKKVRPDTQIFCENGVWNYGGRPLHDHKGYGDLSVQDILIHSSNIGAAKLALGVGDQKFYEYIRRFGFGDRTGIELPGEAIGLLRPPGLWEKIAITRIAMGHGVAVTPLQMCSAMATIANGGKLVTPRVVKSITKADGETVTTFSPTVLRQVISPETAQQIGNALRGVVSDRGTAVGAAVPGFTIAGKTGTAQKIENGVYVHDKYVVSFSGFMPAEHPAFVGLVTLDDAHTKNPELNYGGTVSAPIFAHIAEKAARYLDLERHEEIQKALPVGQVALTNAPRR